MEPRSPRPESRFVTLKRDGAIGIVSLDRQARLNAISIALLDDLLGVLDEVMQDSSLTVLILRGEGRAFCAGNDLKELHTLRDRTVATRFVEQLQAVTRKLMTSDKIVIAAAQGYAVGGGFEWLLNCDLVVAADDLLAYFPEMELGQFVTGGVTHLLPSALGHGQAMELLLLGDRIDARELQQRKLVNRVVATDDLMASALRMARSITGKSRPSVAALKRMVTGAHAAALEYALVEEARETIAALTREHGPTFRARANDGADGR